MKNKSSILSLVHLINFPKILIIISILLSIIGSVFQLLVPLFTQKIIDNFSNVIQNKQYILIFILIFE